MSETTLLQSRPIKEVRIDAFDQQYVARVKWYLEHELQCSLIPMSDERGGYLIRFPPGTLEEVHMGASTQWTYETVFCKLKVAHAHFVWSLNQALRRTRARSRSK